MAEAIDHLKQKIGSPESSGKVTLVLPSGAASTLKGVKNIEGVTTVQADLLNTYQVLNAGGLIFTNESLEIIKEKFLVKTEKRSKKRVARSQDAKIKKNS